MSINHNKVRPVYMNLFQIRLPISAISSITHRLAGIYIFFISLPIFLFLPVFILQQKVTMTLCLSNKLSVTQYFFQHLSLLVF